MKRYIVTIKEQNALKLLSISTGILFALFSFFHGAVLVAIPRHQHSTANTQHVTSAVSCIQQCIVLSKEGLPLEAEQELKNDRFKPFALLLASTSISTGVFYLLPSLVVFLKRKAKIPFYKQVACYRI